MLSEKTINNGIVFQLTSDDKLQILTQLSFNKFVVQNTLVINYFVVGPFVKS